MNNRILSFLLCTVLCFTMFAGVLNVSAKAASTAFTLSTTQGGVGDTITVTVSMSADSYFTNATILLHYNAEAVQFSTEGTGSISPSSAMFLVQDYPRESCVKGAYVAVKPIKKGGDLLTYDFTVMKETEAQFSLSFEECIGEDENGNMFEVAYTTGTCVLNEGKGTPAVTKATTKNQPTTTKASGNVARTTTTRSNVKNTTGNPANTTSGKVYISTTAPNGAGNTTGAPIVTTTVTYPTDTHGITLAPNVVTQADGNAVTEADGAVVTAYTTTTAAPIDAVVSDQSATTMPTDEQGNPIEQSGQMNIPGESNSTNWIVPVIVLVIAFLIAGGAAAWIVIKRKKAKTESE